MRFLFSIHLYPPHHNAGGEQMLHNIAKYLIGQGHECRVLMNEAETYGIKRMYIWEGVHVYPRIRNLEEHFFWADRIITHLGWTSWTVAIAHIFKRPVFFVAQNTWKYPCVAEKTKRVGIIYNCHAAKEALNYPQPSVVVHPPVDFRRYDLGLNPIDHKYITLINLNENKGGAIFWQIARAMPDRQFLAVKGAYDPQIIESLPNVTLVDNTSDIMPIYAQTRILLMPSAYESWGMTATEAMCNGIPVICTPTFGLKENCGEAGIYVGKQPDKVIGDKELPIVTGREDIAAWVREIRALDDKKKYLYQSNLVRQRSRELDPQREYEFLHGFLANPDDPKYLH